MGQTAMERITLVCEDSFDGILTAVYEAFLYKGKQVNILASQEYNYDLFSTYIPVATDYEKSRKVADTVYQKISPFAYDTIYHVAMCTEEEKAGLILGLIIEGLRRGKTVTSELTNPIVLRCSDLMKKVKNEEHFYLEFLRFEELAGGIMFAKIEPKANVMVYVMEHFSDRFPDENFFIYDIHRNMCGVHEKNSPYFIRNQVPFDDILKKWRESGGDAPQVYEEDRYADWWKIFFASISIKERENYELQRNHLPLHFRKHMTEFQRGDK